MLENEDTFVWTRRKECEGFFTKRIIGRGLKVASGAGANDGSVLPGLLVRGSIALTLSALFFLNIR